MFFKLFGWNSEYNLPRHRSSWIKSNYDDISSMSWENGITSSYFDARKLNSPCFNTNNSGHRWLIILLFFIQLDLCLERLYSEFHVNKLRNKATKGILLSWVKLKFWLSLEKLMMWLHFLTYLVETQNITSQDIDLVGWKLTMLISHLSPEKLASKVQFFMPGNSICHLLTPISQDTDVLSPYFLFIQLDLCLER